MGTVPSIQPGGRITTRPANPNGNNRATFTPRLDRDGQVGDYRWEPGSGYDIARVNGNPAEGILTGKPRIFSSNPNDQLGGHNTLEVPLGQISPNGRGNGLKPLGSIHFGSDTEEVRVGDDTYKHNPRGGWYQVPQNNPSNPQSQPTGFGPRLSVEG